MPPLRTMVSFRSAAFNTTTRRSYFINDSCYGDDVAHWIIGELNGRGITADNEPAQEDFGWYLTFRPGSVEHQFILGHRPGDAHDAPEWLGWVERKAGLLRSLIGARNRGIEPAALLAIHDVLTTAKHVSMVRWHRKADFDALNEAAGTSRPDAA